MTKSISDNLLYDPNLYKDIASRLGYGGFFAQKGLDKLMNDSGFIQLLNMSKRLQNAPTLSKKAHIVKEAYLDKEAIDLKKGLTGMALLGSLLNPMKSFADDALLAAAKAQQSKILPNVTKDIEHTIDALAFFKRIGAKAYGINPIAKDLATAKANYQILQKHGIPLGNAPKLHKDVMSLKKSIVDTGDVDLDQAMQLYDRLKKFNTKSTQQIKEFIPPRKIVKL